MAFVAAAARAAGVPARPASGTGALAALAAARPPAMFAPPGAAQVLRPPQPAAGLGPLIPGAPPAAAGGVIPLFGAAAPAAGAAVAPAAAAAGLGFGAPAGLQPPPLPAPVLAAVDLPGGDAAERQARRQKLGAYTNGMDATLAAARHRIEAGPVRHHRGCRRCGTRQTWPVAGGCPGILACTRRCQCSRHARRVQRDHHALRCFSGARRWCSPRCSSGRAWQGHCARPSWW